MNWLIVFVPELKPTEFRNNLPQPFDFDESFTMICEY